MSNAALLQTFFTDRLIAQRRASQYGFLNAPAFLAELFSLPSAPGGKADHRCVRRADCRRKQRSEADLPGLAEKDRGKAGGVCRLLLLFAVLVQRDACSRRCCASASHCAIFSSFAA
jgi:hypothetical protein